MLYTQIFGEFIKDMVKLHVVPHSAFVVIIYYLFYKRIA